MAEAAVTTGINSNKKSEAKAAVAFELVVPTPADFPQLAVMADLAFHEKRGWCGSAKQMQTSFVKSYQRYAKECPTKLQHCRIAVSAITNSATTNAGDSAPSTSADDPKPKQQCRTVLGFCQLQLPGDPGDYVLNPCLRNTLLPGEGYVEMIATHPAYCGQGIGSALLDWAITTCQQYHQQQDNRDDNEQPITRLSLDVMTANKGARRLYERKGFVSKRDPNAEPGDWICAPFFIFFCLGCHYCSVTYMEKAIVAHP